MRKFGAFLCLIIVYVSVIALPGCVSNPEEKILFVNDTNDTYSEILSEIMPDYKLISNDGNGVSVAPSKNGKKAMSAFDVQADTAKKNGFYRYDHFKTSAVIAVDRSACKQKIESWHDLKTLDCSVGFSSQNDGRMLFAAVSYALDKSYLSDYATEIFAALNQKGCFKLGNMETPVLVCWDYQAAQLKKHNSNIEIIIPIEGTLDYSIGIVSEQSINFPSDISDRLFSAGFRSDKRLPEFYPDSKDYERASTVTDYEKFSQETNNFSSTLKRKVMKVRLYSAVDSFEHKLFTAAVMIAVIAWMGYSIRRVQHRKIKCIFAIMGSMIIAWMFITELKYQCDAFHILGRYCWYAYYIFLMGLPLMMLFLSSVIDMPENASLSKYTVYSCVSVYALLLIMVFTNDLHEFVFKFDSDDKYSYHIGYYLIFIFIAFCILLSTVILIKKAMRGFGRIGLILPIVFELLLLAYCVAYIVGVPFIRDGDMTFASCVFSIIFAGVAMKTGLIPVNSKYDLLFSCSPLKMQILDSSGNVKLLSAGAVRIPDNIKSELLKNIDKSMIQDGEFLLYADDIPGGTVVWQENISEILKMQKEIHDNVIKLKAANKLLLAERENKYRLAAAEEKVKLMDMLSKEINSHLDSMRLMLQSLENSNNKQKDIAKITLLLCYIKRRCNLFFKEQEGTEMPVEEIAVYIDELSEFATYADVRVATVCSATGNLTVRRGTVLYDFFYKILEMCSDRESTVLEQLIDVENGVELKLLSSFFDLDASFTEDALKRELDLFDCKITIKELDETAGISLFVPKGGS